MSELQLQKPTRINKLIAVIISGGIIAIGIILFFVFTKKSGTTDYTLIPVSNDGERWGYINTKGEYVINPQFEDADFFSEDGLAKIISNGKTGYINKKGEYVIAATYKNGTAFNEGLAFVVAEGGQPTCIDKSGNTKFVLNTAKFVSAFSEGLAIFVTENEKYGFIDKSGNIVINAQFDEAMPFSGDFARIWQNENVGFIDKTGKITINPQFNHIGNFSEEKASFYDGKQYGYINTKGAYVINPQFDHASKFNDGLAAIRQGKSYGYINKEGKLLINPQFDNASSFSNGLAAVKTGGKFGYINKEGKYEINPQFEYAGDFHNGTALVRNADKWGFINKKGQYVVNPQFRNVKIKYSSDEEQSEFIENDYYDASEFIRLFFERAAGNSFDGINASTTLSQLSEHPVYGANLNARDVNYADYRQTIPITKDIFINNVKFQFNNTHIYEYEDTYSNWGYRTGRTQKWNFNATPDAIVYQIYMSNKASGKYSVVVNAIKNEIESRYAQTMNIEYDIYSLPPANGKPGFQIINSNPCTFTVFF